MHSLKNYKNLQVLKFFNIFLIFLLLNINFASIAKAESNTAKQGDDIEEPTISPIKKGQPAPFEGVLLNSLAVANIKAQIDNFDKECDLSTKKGVEICQANCEFKIKEVSSTMEREKQVLDSSLQRTIKENLDLKNQIEQVQKDQKNVYIWSAGGFLIGTAATILTVFALSQATK